MGLDACILDLPLANLLVHLGIAIDLTKMLAHQETPALQPVYARTFRRNNELCSLCSHLLGYLPREAAQ
jgi:hypothetical protein